MDISLISYIDRKGWRNEIMLGLDHIGVAVGGMALREQFFLAASNWHVVSFKSVTTLGVCHHTHKEIRLNEQLLINGREDAEKSTFMHEIAHMICAMVKKFLSNRGVAFDRKPHGRLWQSISIKLGDDGKRTANYDFFNKYIQEKREATGHKHEYTCKDCGHVYKTRRRLVRIESRFHGPCRYKENKGRLIHKEMR